MAPCARSGGLLHEKRDPLLVKALLPDGHKSIDMPVSLSLFSKTGTHICSCRIPACLYGTKDKKTAQSFLINLLHNNHNNHNNII